MIRGIARRERERSPHGMYAARTIADFGLSHSLHMSGQLKSSVDRRPYFLPAGRSASARALPDRLASPGAFRQLPPIQGDSSMIRGLPASPRNTTRVITLVTMTITPLLAIQTSDGSSHREAPFITELSKVDATDFYMFRSYEPGREDYVTIVANYVPFQVPYGGPNFFQLDPEARYEIHIDNDGDAREDITFRFRFTNALGNIQLNIGGEMVAVPLINVGPISTDDTSALNVTETYSLNVIYGNSDNNNDGLPVVNVSGGGTSFSKPVDNIGAKTFADYEAYARSHIADIMIPGSADLGRVFVGQRDDPFVVNLGEVFDLVNLDPLGPVDGKPDLLADDNVTSLVLELPISFLTQGGEPVIGAWTTASLPKTRVLKNNPGFNKPAQESGKFVQVSRLSMPLVNEVVIGLRDKNRFNNSEPRDDATFLTYVTNPTLPALIEILFGVEAPCLPRNDLVAAFLTGISGLNQPADVTPAEMMRLNTSIAPTPKGAQSELGVLGGDVAGFPNGRRPGDDVVDLSLRVVVGALIDDAGCAPGNTLPLTDGAFVNDQAFDDFFPYLRTPFVASPAGQ
jgi:hypothetical protein